MLFLYTLLFFVLGTSLATVIPPESDQQQHISHLYQPKGQKQKLPLSKFYLPPVPERSILVERIKGVWICKDSTEKYYDHVLRVDKEAIEEIWPPMSVPKLREMLSITKWSRATEEDIKVCGLRNFFLENL
ncbi:hypothetical protein F5887DRAFT_104915 [Amanita rubescens]|nr:hypothetical protein F5887DRAFT_104915 [Amanita rubescens]